MLSDTQKQEIKKKVKESLQELSDKDSFLLEHSVNERSISSKLFMYLQKRFALTVDHEYDKHGENLRKMLEGINECSKRKKNDCIIPDIIIHKRGIDENNLLVIEMKKKRKDRCDIKKLEGLTDQSRMFKYKLGLFIRFNSKNQPLLMWFEDGKEIQLK